MFKFKNGSFLFTVQPPQDISDHHTLNIERGKAKIVIEISIEIAQNEKILQKFIHQFLNDLEFRHHITMLSEPLNSSGFIDLETAKDFFFTEDERRQQIIQDFVAKEAAKEVTEQDYINFNFSRDKFSRMRYTELKLRFSPYVIQKVQSILPIERLQKRAL